MLSLDVFVVIKFVCASLHKNRKISSTSGPAYSDVMLGE